MPFFGDDQEGKHKYHLSTWHYLCQKKVFGGLGIPDLRDLNMCLLAAWAQIYYDADHQLWKSTIGNKYQSCSLTSFAVLTEIDHPSGKG
jgi:hypothetical protein